MNHNQHGATDFLLIILTIVITVGVVFYFALNNRTASELTKIEGYVHFEPNQPRCLALEPSCGVCYGEIIDKECYVDESQLSVEQKMHMGLQ